MSTNGQNTFKILLVGDSGVGKTCFLLKFTDVLNPPTLSGVDFKVRTVEVDDVSVTLQIWDTAGRANRESLYNLKSWLTDIENYADMGVHKIIVGNKCDCKETRVVAREDAVKFAAGLNLEYVETSVKDDINNTNAFETLTRKMMGSNSTSNRSSSNATVSLGAKQPTTKKNSGC